MKILYIIESINFLGGAHVATANLLSELTNQGINVDVLTDTEPSRETIMRFKGIRIIVMPLRRWNIAWLARGVWKYIFHTLACPDWAMDPYGLIRKLLVSYNCVCIMSELSRYKALVSRLPNTVRKVQLIHTDYVAMCTHDSFAHIACRNDSRIFGTMDVIGVVGQRNARRLAEAFPRFAHKITFFHNYMPQAIPRQHATCAKELRIVSAFSFDGVAKDPRRAVHMAIRLVDLGVDIDWTFFGDGSMRPDLELEVAAMGFAEHIHFAGIAQGAKEIFAKADLFVLLSHFEGLPMVIYESLISGVPVFSTNVGGIGEQVQDGENGWLVEDDDSEIYEKLLNIVQNHQTILSAKRRLLGYKYDNEGAIKEHLSIMGILRRLP